MATVMLVLTWFFVVYAFGVWVGRYRRVPWAPWQRIGEKPPVSGELTAQPVREFTPQDLSIAKERLLKQYPQIRHLQPEVQDRILKRLGHAAQSKLSGRVMQ